MLLNVSEATTSANIFHIKVGVACVPLNMPLLPTVHIPTESSADMAASALPSECQHVEITSALTSKSGKSWDKNFGRFTSIIDLSSKISSFSFGYFS